MVDIGSESARKCLREWGRRAADPPEKLTPDPGHEARSDSFGAGCEERELHPIGTSNASVAVAPGRRHRLGDAIRTPCDEAPSGLLAVGHLEREPNRSPQPAAGLDLVDDFGLSLVEEFERPPPAFRQAPP